MDSEAAIRVNSRLRLKRIQAVVRWIADDCRMSLLFCLVLSERGRRRRRRKEAVEGEGMLNVKEHAGRGGRVAAGGG